MGGGGLRCAVLGETRLLRSDGSAVFLPRAPLRVLTALLTAPRQAVKREVIARALWSHNLPSDPPNRIQVAVSQLRSILCQEDGGGGRLAVTTTAGGYRLDVEPEDVDHELFEREAQAAANGAANVDVPRLMGALALWAGTPFADLADDAGALPRITRLEAIREGAELRLAGALLVQGRHAEALDVLEAARCRNPLDERVAAALMQVFVADGQRSAAHEAYAHCRLALEEELGMDPGPALRAQHLALLALETPSAVAVAEDAVVGPSSSSEGRRFVCVSGEPGAGKTALVAGLVRHAREQSVEVMRGCCAVGSPARQPLRDAFRARPDLLEILDRGGGVSGASDVELLERGLVGRRQGGAVLLVLEDLQWADEGTLAFVEHLARTADDVDLTILLTITREEDRAGHATRTWANLSRHAPVEHLALRPLDARQVRDLVALCAPGVSDAIVERILRRSGGNPAAVVALAAALGAPHGERALHDAAVVDAIVLPAEVRERQLRQLSTLSPVERVVLGACARLEWARARPATPLEVASQTGIGVEVVAAAFATGLARRLLVREGSACRTARPLLAEELRGPVSTIDLTLASDADAGWAMAVGGT